MAMREGEILKKYSDRYWEMFNEIDGNFDDVAIRTFKVGLPAKHDDLSLFLGASPRAIIASSTFMYFMALYSILAIVFGSFL